MSTRFLTESDIVERTQIKSGSHQEILNSPDEVIFVRLPEVKAVTGLSKSSLYALIRANNFPAPVRLGPRTVAWVKSEVKQWAVERVLTSRSATSHQGSKLMPQPSLRETWASSKKWLRLPMFSCPWQAVHPDNQPTTASGLRAASDTSRDCRQRPLCCASCGQVAIQYEPHRIHSH
jgi:prophage regulatory protein